MGREIKKKKTEVVKIERSFCAEKNYQLVREKKVLRPNKERGKESLVSLPQPTASVGIIQCKTFLSYPTSTSGTARGKQCMSLIV